MEKSWGYGSFPQLLAAITYKTKRYIPLPSHLKGFFGSQDLQNKGIGKMEDLIAMT